MKKYGCLNQIFVALQKIDCIEFLSSIIQPQYHKVFEKENVDGKKKAL